MAIEMAIHCWRLMIYRWRYLLWYLHIGYPSMGKLHIDAGRYLDHDSRHRIYDRWDTEWEARKPERPKR